MYHMNPLRTIDIATAQLDILNTLRPRQNRRHFADDIFKWIFLNENIWIPIKISLKFVPQGPINNIPALVQIMAWRRPGDKPLSGPMVVRLPTHRCVTRPQWVNNLMSVIWGLFIMICMWIFPTQSTCKLTPTPHSKQQRHANMSQRTSSNVFCWIWTHLKTKFTRVYTGLGV